MQATVFETERLFIRPLREEDAPAYHRLFRETDVHCFAEERRKGPGEVRAELAEKAGRGDGSELAVCLRGSGEFIGTLFGLWEGDTFSVCWCFSARHRGRGYALEAARAWLDFLFSRMGARRVYAYVETDNTSSRRLCERLGMRLEGEFLEFISFVDGPDGEPIYENTLQYAILKKEWRPL